MTLCGQVVIADVTHWTTVKPEVVRQINSDNEVGVATADIVTFHVILTKETTHMLGARELRLMKPNAVVINTSRGPVIDEPELIKALQDVLARADKIGEEEGVRNDANACCTRRRVFC